MRTQAREGIEMANFMTRRFTLRERILLIIFIVILLVGLYFFLVFYPIRNSLNEIAAEKEKYEERIQVAEIREDIYEMMEEELEEIFKLPEDQLTYMPEYDNIQDLMVKFNGIFTGLEPQISYGQATLRDGIYSRSISFSFSISSFEEAKRVITELTKTGYRCLLNSISVLPSNSSDIKEGALRISGSITFYEIQK